MALPDTSINACCVASYAHPLARWLLGDSFHPGGLKLTTQLAQGMGLHAASTLLDAGSGRGASVVHLAQMLGCRAVGVTLEEEGATTGYDLARQQRVEDRVAFLQGDIQEVDLETGAYSAVMMECELSILPQKEATLRRLHDVLQPDGRLGVTDVTVNGPLPTHLQGVLAVAGCTGDARSLEEYSELVRVAGFTVDYAQDLPETASSFLRDIRGKLLMAEVAIRLGKVAVSLETLAEGKRVLEEVLDLASRGVLSYGMVVAHRPA